MKVILSYGMGVDSSAHRLEIALPLVELVAVADAALEDAEHGEQAEHESGHDDDEHPRLGGGEPVHVRSSRRSC